MTEDLARRQLLRLAGASALGATGVGVGGCARGTSGHSAGLASTVSGPGHGFVSRPDLTPPRIWVRRYGAQADAAHIFLNAPYSGPGHGGTIIVDADGQLVWFGPNTSRRRRMNLSVQAYQGGQVLTWWQGQVVGEGWGVGEVVIADSSYRVIRTIRAANGLSCDFHDFYITAQNTALITAYKAQPWDLSTIGGPRTGVVVSGVAQEIDIATGELLFSWDSLAPHLPPGRNPHRVQLDETYQPYTSRFGTTERPFNYFHINSIAPWDDEHLLISARNTWALYLVEKSTGAIVWRMNGKRSDFTMAGNARFFWQHHVRLHSNGLLTVFDNGALPAEEKQSRALELHVDMASRQVALSRAFVHPGTVVQSGAMGSAQLLGNGDMFVGWGTTPRFSQFAADGTLVLDGGMQHLAPSYRALAQNWSGRPAEPPAAAARRRAGGAIVYASWNGATGIGAWQVFAGKTPVSLRTIGSAHRSGFETAIEVDDSGPYFAVQAVDTRGRPLAKSAPVKIA